MLPTQGAANPALTIMALAARAADRLIARRPRRTAPTRRRRVMTATGSSSTASRTAVYRFPTPEPEADGTLTWDATTAVTVERRRRRPHRAGLDLQHRRGRRA